MMNKALLIVTNGTTCHKHHLEPGKVVRIGSGHEDDICYPELNSGFDVNLQEETWFAGSTALEFNSLTKIELEEAKPLSLFLADDLVVETFDVSAELSVTFGSGSENDVVLRNLPVDFVLLRDTKEALFEAHIFGGEIYYNFERAEKGTIALGAGDQLYIGGIQIAVGQDELTLTGPKNSFETRLASLYAADSVFGADYPDYHRSPRIIYRAPEDKITLSKPSAKPAKPTEGILKLILPPLVMIAITVLISIFQPRGIYILMTLAMTGMTVIMSLTTYIKNSKKYKVDMKDREENYDLYLKRKTKELFDASEKQRKALDYHYPSITEIRDMALRIDSRIYEKNADASRFPDIPCWDGDGAEQFFGRFS